MQAELLRLAIGAGAEVRRGVTVTKVEGGTLPAVAASTAGVDTVCRARLLVGADGRESRVRTWGGFGVSRAHQRILITGVLLAGCPADEDAIHLFPAPTFGDMSIVFPLGGTRARVYAMTGRRAEHPRLSGEAAFPELTARCVAAGAPGEWFARARVAGPLATFEAASAWVDHPYRNGVVLIGDAAAASDPSWGGGLSLTLRDVRELRDHLLGDDNWATACEIYAAEHDRYFAALDTVESWLTEVFYGLGPEADRVRAHAMPALVRGEGPDLVGLGPENVTDEAARLRFLGG